MTLQLQISQLALLEEAFNSVLQHKHATCWTQGERGTIDLWFLAEPSTDLMLCIQKYRVKSILSLAIIFKVKKKKKKRKLMLKEQLIISVSFVTSHVCSKMSLSYSDCSMWREYMLYFFPLPFPHSLSLSLPVPKMSLLGILSPGSFWSSGLSLPPLSCNLWGITLWSTHSPPHCLRTVTAYNNCYAN